MTEGLRNFAKQYNYAINDPDLIRRYRMIEDGKRDVATKIAVAEKRGEERGEIRGDRYARLNIARNMKNDGYDDEVIAKYFGLSAEEIADLNESRINQNTSQR